MKRMPPPGVDGPRPASGTAGAGVPGDAPGPATDPAASGALWLALYLPGLSLEALPDRPAEHPCAVVEEHGTRAPLRGVCARAHAAGARAGMGAGAAVALVPGLVLLARSRSAERAVLARVLRIAARFSSLTAPAGEDTVLAEVGASTGLFGGLDALRVALVHAVAARGLTVQAACAPSPAAARVLARTAPGTTVTQRAGLAAALAGLPVTALGLSARTAAALHAMGVTTVGAAARLPRAGFARRFGAPALDLLDRLHGRVAEPIAAHRPPARFRRTAELAAPAADLGGVRAVCAQLVDALCAWLHARGQGVQALAVDLRTAGGARREAGGAGVRLTLAAPTQQAGHLLALLGERLDRVVLGAPVEAVTLRALLTVDLAPTDAAGLFGPTAGERWQRLAERLHARLGEHAVQGLAQHADHRPEHAWRACAPGQVGPALPPQGHAPVWLLARPRRLAVRDDRPWLDGPLTLLTPPWRIEAGWWSGADVRRDYHAAQDTAGRCWWVYRAVRSGRWYLHGRYH